MSGGPIIPIWLAWLLFWPWVLCGEITQYLHMPYLDEIGIVLSVIWVLLVVIGIPAMVLYCCYKFFKWVFY